MKKYEVHWANGSRIGVEADDAVIDGAICLFRRNDINGWSWAVRDWIAIELLMPERTNDAN